MMGTIVIFVNLIIDSASAYQILQHASQYTYVNSELCF